MKFEERKTIAVYLDKEDFELLQKLAREKGLSLASFCRFLILKFLREYTLEKEKKLS